MIFTILGLLLGIIIFVNGMIIDVEKWIIYGLILILFNTIVLDIHLENRKERSMYREKITIITYEDSIPIDTVVIFR